MVDYIPLQTSSFTATQQIMPSTARSCLGCMSCRAWIALHGGLLDTCKLLFMDAQSVQQSLMKEYALYHIVTNIWLRVHSLIKDVWKLWETAVHGWPLRHLAFKEFNNIPGVGLQSVCLLPRSLGGSATGSLVF